MTQNAAPLDFAKAPIVDKTGNPSWNMLRWIQKIETKTNRALTTLGINPNASIVGTNKTIGGVTSNLTTNGLLPTNALTGSVSGTQVGFNLDEVPDGTTRFAVTNLAGTKGVAQVDAADLAIINFASAHQNKTLDNVNDGTTYQRFTRVASGQLALPTVLIGAGTAATATAANAAVLATDAIEWAFATAPAAGYASLSVIAYVTAGNVNFQIGNPSAAGVTPAAQTVNYVVIR